MTIPIRRPPQLDARSTPFELVRDSTGLRTARKSLVLTLCRHIEELAGAHGDPPVVMTTFQRPAFFTPHTAKRYRALVRICSAVVVLGAPPVAEPESKLHRVELDPADPLHDEWTIVVVGAHYAVALIARDLGDTGPDQDRRYEFLLTHDRLVVVLAGQILLTRMA